MGLEQRIVLLELGRTEFGERETVPGECDGGREDVRQRLASVGLHQLAPAGEIAGRRDRQGPARQVGALAEAIGWEARRDRWDEVENAHALLGTDPHRRETHPGQAGHERLDHIQGGRGGGGGVEGVAALPEEARSGLGCEGMGGGDHAVAGGHGGASAKHRCILIERCPIRA